MSGLEGIEFCVYEASVGVLGRPEALLMSEDDDDWKRRGSYLCGGVAVGQAVLLESAVDGCLLLEADRKSTRLNSSHWE